MSTEKSIEKVMNRWFGLVGTSFLWIAYGAAYAWFAFNKVLSDPDGASQFTVLQTARIFSAALFFVSLMMIFSSLRW